MDSRQKDPLGHRGAAKKKKNSHRGSDMLYFKDKLSEKLEMLGHMIGFI